MATSTPYLFGLTDLRMGTRIIACIYFVVYMIIFLGATVESVTEYWNFFHGFDYNYHVKITFGLSFTLLNTYVSYYLRKATYSRNLEHIKIWMILNFIYVITELPITVIETIPFMGEYSPKVVYLYFVIVINCYCLFVVKQFYLDESSLESYNEAV